MISAGACFKIGFFASLGAFCFGLLASVLMAVLSIVVGLIFGAALFPVLEDMF